MGVAKKQILIRIVFPEIFRGDKRIVGWTFVSQNIHDCQLI